MKQIVKKILPRSVLNGLLETRDNIRLQGVRNCKFNETNLKTSGEINLPEILGNEKITDVWQKDQPLIGEVYGENDNYGGVNPGDRRALYYLIMALKPAKVLEVGTHIGASTLHIARAMKRTGGKLITADILDVNTADGPWKQVGLKSSPAEFARRLDCLDRIEFQVGRCQDYMRSTKERFDFIFLDGDHRASAVYQEVGAALKILNPGGVILLHDFYPGAKALYPDKNTITGPFHALERIGRENPAITVLPLGALPWPTKQGVNLTSLALVCKAA